MDVFSAKDIDKKTCHLYNKDVPTKLVNVKGEIRVMKKTELLERYKEEGRDEGKDYINQRGDNAGFYGLTLLALLITIYQAIMKLPLGDMLSLLFCFLSVGLLSRYKADKEKINLFAGIVTGIISLTCLCWYVWKTLA